MAAVSARCLRSLTRISSTINKGMIKGVVNGASQSRSLSSLTAGNLLKDNGLLRSIARDNMAKNLAKRHARLSVAVSQLLVEASVNLSRDGGEGSGLDELSIEISDDDDKLRI